MYELTKVVVGPFEDVNFVDELDWLVVLLFDVDEDLFEDVLLALVEDLVELLREEVVLLASVEEAVALLREEDLLDVEEIELVFEDDLVLRVDVFFTLELVEVLLVDFEDDDVDCVEDLVLLMDVDLTLELVELLLVAVKTDNVVVVEDLLDGDIKVV